MSAKYLVSADDSSPISDLPGATAKTMTIIDQERKANTARQQGQVLSEITCTTPVAIAGTLEFCPCRNQRRREKAMPHNQSPVARAQVKCVNVHIPPRELCSPVSSVPDLLPTRDHTTAFLPPPNDAPGPAVHFYHEVSPALPIPSTRIGLGLLDQTMTRAEQFTTLSTVSNGDVSLS